MQAFLSPGIKLLGRFGFAGKFQLLFLLFILPLAGSLLMIGQDYRDKLNLISGERAGVRQLLALDALDNLLAAQRDRAARWRATETNRQPTPATLAAMGAFDAVQPAVAASHHRFGQRPAKRRRGRRNPQPLSSAANRTQWTGFEKPQQRRLVAGRL